MPRYVDAEPIEKFITDGLNQEKSYGWVGVEILTEVHYTPTADVAPVVHGHWIAKREIVRSPNAKNYNCSICGAESFAYPNCPYCRSVMDEEAKENAGVR